MTLGGVPSRGSRIRNQAGPRGNAGREGTPMLTVVTESEPTSAAPNPTAPAVAGGSMIDEIVRDGARRMLAAALEAEVAAYIAAYAEELDERGRRLVVRNGHAEPRQVLTSDLMGRGGCWLRRWRPRSPRTSRRTPRSWTSAVAASSCATGTPSRGRC